MKVALVLVLLAVVAAVYAEGEACTSDADCTADCPQHGSHVHVNHCHHGHCHCHSQHTCSSVSDCACNSGFTPSCDHGHCHCHHNH